MREDEAAVNPAVQAATDAVCSIERTASIVKDRWSVLILRSVLLEGRTRFADIQSRIGIATNILTARLGDLVTAGVITKQAYRQDGARTRYEYVPTEAGRALVLVLAALQQWGDDFVPPPSGTTVARVTDDGHDVRVGFVGDDDAPVGLDSVRFEPTAAFPRPSGGGPG